MSVPHRTPDTPTDPADAPQTSAGPPTTPTGSRMPHTRTSAAWIAICTAALSFVVLIIFMLQNTRSVEVTFLWMHGTLPLALALFIAAVGSAILAMAVGVARITQLRRMFRRQHH